MVTSAVQRAISEAIPTKSLEVQLRQAVVQAVDLSTQTITIDLSSDPDGIYTDGIKYVRTYAPAVGDTVWVLRNDTDLLVVGLQGGAPDANFVPLNLTNPTWTELNNASYPLGCKLHTNGTVEFRGLIHRNSGTGMPTTMFTLDSKYRPAYRRAILCNKFDGGIANLYVNPDGVVQFAAAPVGVVGSTVDIDISGVWYTAGQ